MTVHKQRLIIFTRYPEPGVTKTRLIPRLGAEGAAELQRMMTEHTVQQARKAGLHIEICFSGGSPGQMKAWLGEELDYVEQAGGDLGNRMERAFTEAFSSGMDRVVIVGCDCPANNAQNLQEAFASLTRYDVVIGPAYDGGYYLIGLTRRVPPAALFQNIEWGGDRVFAQTLQASSGFRTKQLKRLNDVDRPEDIPPKISVIIPALNEKQQLPETLRRIQQGFNTEILLVDGGSTDGTEDLLQDTLSCRAGRAAQQNLGASKSKGELLLFLHADTELPDNWDGVIRDALADPTVVLGAFTFRIKERVPGLRCIEASTNWRSRSCSLPYGDQGFFIRRSDFEASHGFPDLPIMEDYAFVRSLRGKGKIITVPEAAATSGRRWLEHGVIKVTVLNWMMVLGYHLGIAPERLARFYRGRRGACGT